MQQKLKQMALFSNSEINTGRQMAVDMAKFFFEGDKLYFCIGDVSGKGVPAETRREVLMWMMTTGSCLAFNASSMCWTVLSRLENSPRKH